MCLYFEHCTYKNSIINKVYKEVQFRFAIYLHIYCLYKVQVSWLVVAQFISIITWSIISQITLLLCITGVYKWVDKNCLTRDYERQWRALVTTTRTQLKLWNWSALYFGTIEWWMYRVLVIYLYFSKLL